MLTVDLSSQSEPKPRGLLATATNCCKMQGMLIFPPAPKHASDDEIANAKSAAIAAYLGYFKKKRRLYKWVAPTTPVVSSAHCDYEKQNKGADFSFYMRRAGYVRLGRARNGNTGYTTIYVRSELVGNYDSPTAAFKEFQQCAKS